MLKFGIFELDSNAGELYRAGRRVPMPAQPMRMLIMLVERAGDVVSREELQRAVWGDDTHVDFDAGLSTGINQIRSALGDRAGSPRFVETLPRRGYRFIAPIDRKIAPLDRPVVPVRTTASGSRTVLALATALLLLIGLMMSSLRPQLVAKPIPIAVFAVDVDASTPHLQPIAETLTHALIGTLATELGDRGRVASPFAARAMQDRPMHEILEGETAYVLLVTLRSQGGPVLVHLKLVGKDESVRWAADRALSLSELEQIQLQLARELSKEAARVMTSS